MREIAVSAIEAQFDMELFSEQMDIESGKRGHSLKREYFADLKQVRDGEILPLLVAALQGQITARYDIAGLEQIEELRD